MYCTTLVSLILLFTCLFNHSFQGSEFQGNRKADFHERQRLVQLVQLQAQEIDALKDEIGVLSTKGGHILPPPRSSIPPGHSVTQ